MAIVTIARRTNGGIQMKTVKLRVIKDFEDGELKFKKGQIIDVNEKHHTGYIKMGVVEYVEKTNAIKKKTSRAKKIKAKTPPTFNEVVKSIDKQQLKEKTSKSVNAGFIAQKVSNPDILKDISTLIKKYDLIPYDGSVKSYKTYHTTFQKPNNVDKLDISKYKNKSIINGVITKIAIFSNKIVLLLDNKKHIAIAEGKNVKQCLNENKDFFNKLKGEKLLFDDIEIIKQGVTYDEKTINKQDIERYWEHINHSNKNFKFQCFKKDGSASKQIDVDSTKKLIELCEQHNLQGLSCLSVNPRLKNKTTTDSVMAILNILIDVDVKKDRKIDGISTLEDKQIAKKTALAIIKELEENLNLRVSLFVDSGNGYHIYIPMFISLDDFFIGKNPEENKGIWDNSEIKGRLISLEQKLSKFNNDVCEIDCISKDIARRVKIPGTWNVKGGIEEKNYRLSQIITAHEETLKKVFVEGNTDVFNTLEPVEDEIDEQETNIPVDETIDLQEILQADVKARRLFEGDWKRYNKKLDEKTGKWVKRKTWSRSEAEQSLSVILLSKGLPEKRVRIALENAKIGKWNEKKGTAKTDYQNSTIKHAKQFIKDHPELRGYYLFDFEHNNKKYQIQIRQEKDLDDVFYCLVDNNGEGLETKTTPDFLNDNRKRNDFFKDVTLEIGADNRSEKKELKRVLVDVLKQIQQQKFLHTRQQKSEGNGKRGQRGQRGQRHESNRRNIIHGAGGLYDDLVIEPLGNYCYLYNYKDKKGKVFANFDPDTKVASLDINGENFYFKSKPLKDCLFRTPSDNSIEKYLNGSYPIKTKTELYNSLVNFYKIFYEVPGEFYYHIIAIGTLQSWLIEVLSTVFYLCFSAQFGAGKTAFLEGGSIVSHHGFLAGNISSASVARATAEQKLSLWADELDVKSNSKDNETFLTFRQGYKRNNPYVRQKETRTGYVNEIFDTFSSKSYSVHSKSEDALGSRGIEIPLRISDDKTLPVLNMYKEQLGFPLFEDLFFWYMENATMLITSTMATRATEKNTRATDFLLSLPSLPSFPRFLAPETGVCNIKKVRDQLFKEYTKSFSEKEIETLKVFFGRNEELIYIALLVCKIFEIDQLANLEHTFKQKVQNEGDDNIFVNLLKEYLKEIFQDNRVDKDMFLSTGDFEGCFYYEKSKAYRGFRKKLKDEDFFPIDSGKFEEYLMVLKFNKGVNVKKEKIKLPQDKTTTRLCLIFDDDVMSYLELEKPKSLEDFKPAQYDKIQDAIKIIQDDPDDNYETILDKFGQIFIDKCIEQKVFREALLGKRLDVV